MPTDKDLIDAIKHAFDFKTDIEVANFLDIDKQTIYLARSKKCPLGIKQRFKIIDRILEYKIKTYHVGASLKTLSHDY